MLLLNSLVCFVSLWFGMREASQSARLLCGRVPDHSLGIEQVTRSPHITFDTIYRDLKSVKIGSVVNRKYVVGNSGSAPLLIQSVRPTAANILVSIEDSVIAPGDITMLHVRFDTRGERPGLITRSIVIESNSVTDATSIVGFHAILETGATVHSSKKN